MYISCQLFTSRLCFEQFGNVFVNFETEYNVNIDRSINKVLIGKNEDIVSMGIRAGSPIISSPIKSLKITEITAALTDPQNVKFFLGSFIYYVSSFSDLPHLH